MTVGASLINFAEFPPSWKEEVKAFAANGIMARGLSNGWVPSTLSALRLLVHMASERRTADIPPTLLDREDARRLVQHVRAQGLLSPEMAVDTRLKGVVWSH